MNPGPPPSPVDVEVSVVSHTDQGLVRACLRSLPAACRGVTWRTTVVENLPPDGPPLAAEFPEVRVVTNTAPAGFGPNHNAVLAPVVHEGRARYVLVLNDDTELAPGCVAALVARADADSRLGVVGPTIEFPDGRRQHSFYSFPSTRRIAGAALRPGRLPCEAVDTGPGWLSGACLLLRVDALREVGLFDPRFFLFFEDTDLGTRLAERGWQAAVCAEASIVHLDHQTVSRPELRAAMQRQMLRSMYLYFGKHHGERAARSVALVCRAALGMRGLWSLAEATLLRRPSARARGHDLLRLASYAPWTPLPHEPAGSRPVAPAAS